MHKHSPRHNNGFVALISAILISAMLLALLLATNLSSFYARFDALDAEHYQAAQNLAGACAREALLRMAQNYWYAPAPGGDGVLVGADRCTIVGVSSPDMGDDRTITASATKGDSYANVIVVAHVKNLSAAAGGPNISIISWQEE